MSLKVKQGEAKTLTFTITDAAGAAANVATATCTLKAKSSRAASAFAIEKADGDFDKTSGASGILTVVLDADDTDIAAGRYIMELHLEISASNVDKSADFDLVIEESLF